VQTGALSAGGASSDKAGETNHAQANIAAA
jgi:hypothetical protein